MADLPILSPADIDKVPQTTKNSVTNVISFNTLAGYFFRDDLTYKVDDVFIVDNSRNLDPIQIAKNANDNHIPFDIKYSGMAVTITNPAGGGVNIACDAGKIQIGNSKTIVTTGAISANPSSSYVNGGIAWVSIAASGNALFSDHDRAFDAGAPFSPMLVAVQSFSATESYSNKYYLGTSIADSPLYSTSMLFRNMGWKFSGLAVDINDSGWLQISSGTISNWYNENIKVPQTARATFYYANNSVLTTAPTFTPITAMTMDSTDTGIKRIAVTGQTIAPIVNNTTAFHFIYLDPSTLKVYIFLGDRANSVTPAITNNADILWRAINAYAKHSTMVYTAGSVLSKTIGMFNENCILLGAIMVNANFTTFSQLKIIPLHKYMGGTGNALHPMIPDPEDYPNGGKLKAKNNVYKIAYDYDGLLISRATALKNNYLFMYDDRSEFGIVEAEYVTTPTPWITLQGMGGFGQYVSNLLPDAYTKFYYSYYDHFTYQDVGRSGVSSVSPTIYLSSSTAGYPSYAVAEIFYNAFVVFRNNISMPKLSNTTSTMYHGILGLPGIPGMNTENPHDTRLVQYSDTIRNRRADHGSADSVIIIESIIGNTAAITDEYCAWIFNNALTPQAQAMITQLINLIGILVATEVKSVFEAVKKAGMLCDVGHSINAITHYYFENNSAVDKIDYCITGYMGFGYTPSGTTAMGTITVDAVNYPIVIQPADVVTLTSGDMSPMQATFFWLAIRTSFMFFIGSNLVAMEGTENLGALRGPKIQVSEITSF